MSLLPESTYRRVHKAAVTITATELAVFAVDESRSTLTNVVHLRPGCFHQKEKAPAEEAFRHIVADCLGHQRDGLIRVNADDGPRRQYCFVHFGRSSGKIVFAAAFIRRCADEQNARLFLEVLQRFEMFR